VAEVVSLYKIRIFTGRLRDFTKPFNGNLPNFVAPILLKQYPVSSILNCLFDKAKRN
jgi:hypothetical protein